MTRNIATIVDRKMTNLAITIDRTQPPYVAPDGGTARIVYLDYAQLFRSVNRRLAENTVDPGYGIDVTWAPWAGSVEGPTHTEAAVCVQDANRNAIVWKWILPVPGDWNCARIVGMIDPRIAIIYEDDIIDEREDDYFHGLAILKEHYKAEMRNHLMQTARFYPAEALPPQRNNRCILLDTR